MLLYITLCAAQKISLNEIAEVKKSPYLFDVKVFYSHLQK